METPIYKVQAYKLLAASGLLASTKYRTIQTLLSTSQGSTQKITTHIGIDSASDITQYLRRLSDLGKLAGVD